ncbi:MAG: hypothetical protein J6W28_06210 [Clostridia bacterium]|nr:hypothetical protein [Clostridia bacterium]
MKKACAVIFDGGEGNAEALRKRLLRHTAKEELEHALGVPVSAVENDGYAFYEALLGIE